MGFLDSVFKGLDFIEKVVTTTVETVFKPIIAVAEVIDEVMGWDKKEPKTINEEREKVSKEISKTESYDENKATISQTQQLIYKLDDFKRPAIKSANIMEERLVEYGRKIIKQLTSALSADDKENFAALCQRELDGIRGIVAGELASKISLSNQKCKNILALGSGADKEKKMNEFIANTTRKAFRKLGERFAQGIKTNADMMIHALKDELKFQCDLRDSQLKTLSKIKETNSVEQRQSEQGKLALDLAKQIKLLSLIKEV